MTDYANKKEQKSVIMDLRGFKCMKILTIGTDRGLFEENSEVRQRVVEYGRLVEELHIVVFSRRNSQFSVTNFQNVYVYPTNSLTKFNYILDAIKIGKTILKETRNKTQDTRWLVSTQDAFECGYVGYKLARFFGCKLQLQVHTDFLSPYFAGESLLNKIRVRMAKFLIPKADGIRVVSERIKKSIIVNCKLKIENSAIAVLPIFVDVEKIKNTPIKTDLRRKYTKFGYIILMAGRLAREKNMGMAIEALAVIAKEYRSTGLVIVGAGPQKKNLAKKAERLGLKENVSFEEWTDDLASYYKTSDLFLLTSNYEGYGRTLVEAMASGCPIVTTDVGLVGDVIRDRFNAFVVPVKGRQGLYEAVHLLVVSPERAKDLAHAGEQTVRDFPTRDEYLEQYKKSWGICL